MRKPILIGVIVLLVMPCLSVVGETPQEMAGSITDVKGTVHLVRGGEEVAVEKGTRLITSDVIRTDEGSSVGIVLRDDSTLSLGASSELKMSDFTFKPDEGILGMTLSVIKGTMVYISGQIAKLAPGSAQIETPAGVAAIRGTELLVEVPAPKEKRRAEKTN